MLLINNQKRNFNIIFIAAIVALGGFLVGFDAGVIVDGKDQITSEFYLSTFQWSMLVSISVLGALLVVPVGGKLADKYSAKTMIILISLIFIIGLVFTITAYNLTLLFLGRFITGVCIGITAFAVPLYISEISPPKIRGGMILLNGIAITGGQTLSYLTAYFLHDLSPESWRIILLIEIAIVFFYFFSMKLMPESPRWIARNRGIDDARTVLNQIRGGNSTIIDHELNQIAENISRKLPKPNLKYLFSKNILPILFVGMGLGIFQQFVGINAIIYYGPVIFQALGFKTIKNAIFATFLIGLVNLIFTIISAFTVDLMGRRFLLLLGTLIAALSLFFLSISRSYSYNTIWAILFMSTYIIGYCISLGSLFWVMIAEIYPSNIRGLAMSVITAVQYAANFVVTISFLQILDSFGDNLTFIIFSTICLLAYLFIYICVPETKGIQLEIIEANLLNGKKTRHLGQCN